MDQNVIAGIGNIYSDEILFEAKVHPLREVQNLKDEEMKKIYLAMKKILKKGIELKGESISDYRRPSGEKGDFDKERRVYRRENQPCFICQTKIKRIKLGGRSSYFCPKCQK
jgi:formamidopyrimidine-DNA glycosylase